MPTASGAAQAASEPAPPGMVWIPAGTFTMGGRGEHARPDELPQHEVELEGFWMDRTEVTNRAFRAFVDETGYVTTAERAIDWSELAQQLPPGTPAPDPELLQPGSLVFRSPGRDVPLDDVSSWWNWTTGASWRAPQGPGSTLEGLEDHPVVQVSWDDAVAYATWAGKRLPTEAEWEWAARGGAEDPLYPWGDERVDDGAVKANTWQGRFPAADRERDGFGGTAPVGRFAPNGYGLFDMAGNVWEWCSDWYRSDTYAQRSQREPVQSPSGPATSLDPYEPMIKKRVQRGGSFLCNDAYCAGYRVGARMKASPDTGLSHSGFRCVR